MFDNERPGSECLINITIKDIAPENISKSLLHARELGQKQYEVFVKKRLISDEEGNVQIRFNESLPKNKPSTFAGRSQS